MDDAEFAALTARVQRLEDEREINEVVRRWHHECTGGFNGKQAGRMEALECLTEDATIEIWSLHEPGKGPRGREQYTQYWEYYFGDNGPLPYVFQSSLDPSVETDGDTATQESVMIGIFQPRGMNAWFGLMQRKNWMVRTPEGWKISKTTATGGFTTSLNDLLGNLNQLPAQEPRTEWKYSGP